MQIQYCSVLLQRDTAHHAEDRPMQWCCPILLCCATVQATAHTQLLVDMTHRILLLLHGGKQLWRHPGQGAPHVPAHKGCRLFLGQTQVSDLHHWSVQVSQIAQQIVALQIKVYHSARVQVLHACVVSNLLSHCLLWLFWTARLVVRTPVVPILFYHS